MAKLKSEGKCVYCNKIYALVGISRHLATHLKALEKEKSSTKKAYHLKMTAAEMFLHVLVDGAKPLNVLDGFLRAIWLECCGHMSSFEVKGKRYDNDWDAGDIGEKKSSAMSKIFQKDMVLDYQYDFGSTTQFSIKVMGEYEIGVKGGIELLSRNEPLEIKCHTCNTKLASVICSVCFYDEAMFCKSCAKKHAKACEDFADYAEMAVVNSPRMGVCGYDGGQIDLGRDGVFKK
ncbi:MAG: hypothetical protein ACI9XO_002979 [Paraglaciecola sp.]|jgi:hypothetical protein